MSQKNVKYILMCAVIIVLTAQGKSLPLNQRKSLEEKPKLKSIYGEMEHDLTKEIIEKLFDFFVNNHGKEHDELWQNIDNKDRISKSIKQSRVLNKDVDNDKAYERDRRYATAIYTHKVSQILDNKATNKLLSQLASGTKSIGVDGSCLSSAIKSSLSGFLAFKQALAMCAL